MKQQRRFTLVEMMIVVSIVGVLAVIAIPGFVNARSQARKNACIDNLRLIDGAKEQWALENNKSPGEDCALKDLLGNYLKTAPTCAEDGTYEMNPVNTPPTCTADPKKGHVLQ